MAKCGGSPIEAFLLLLSALGCFDLSFSLRFDECVDVLLAAAMEYKQLSFR